MTRRALSDRLARHHRGAGWGMIVASRLPLLVAAAGAIVLAGCVTTSIQANAADITSTVSKEGKIIVSIVGNIAEGDAETFKSIIKSANDGGRLVSGVRLNSPGGNLLEGTKLAEIIRFGKIATVLANGAQCASACFVVFAAGDPKFVSYAASIGVHGASDMNGRETIEAGAATVSMARIVKDLGVPAAIIGKMVVTPPDQMVWLGPDDLRSMGATMTGKPAQVPPAQNNDVSQSQMPMQLDPYARATVPSESPAASANGPPPTWTEIADAAFLKSRQQNGGQTRSSRSCQPELKLCSVAVFFRGNDGTDMMLRIAENPFGKIIQRDICQFNNFGDVRFCIDWDTGTKIREMQNQHGDWIKVGDE
jgi:hypothetical protein